MSNYNAYIISLIAVFVLFYIRDIFSSPAQQISRDSLAGKEKNSADKIVLLDISGNEIHQSKGQLYVQYCASWGYKNYFHQLQRFTVHSFPELTGKVHGTVYPPSKLAQVVSTITGGMWFAGLALLFAGDTIMPMIGFTEEPVLYKYMKENKMLVGGALFIANNIGNGMLSTGAFEVYYNGELIFSKLKTGQVPRVEDIIYALEAAGLERLQNY